MDGKTNPKIQSIYLEGFPVYKARFSADGEQVIATSIHEKLFYIYDMMGGKIIPVNHIRGKVLTAFYTLLNSCKCCLSIRAKSIVVVFLN